MKIVYVVDYFPPHIGGVEELFGNLAKELSPKHEIDVLTMALPGTKLYDDSQGYRIHRAKCASRYTFAAKFPQAARLMRKADIVHTTTFIPTGTTWLGRWLADVPVVTTFHEIWRDFFFKVQPFPSALFNYMMEWSMCTLYKDTPVVTPSFYTKRALVKFGFSERNIDVIPPGIDHSAFNSRTKPFRKFEDPTYLFYGRPGLSKGLEYLLEAAPLVAQEMPGAKLMLLVSRSDRDYAKVAGKIDALAKRGLAISLEPQKSATGVASIIRAADVVCVPSLSEGFGLTAVEPQACGVPVVATRAGSLPEVVKGGILVEPRDPAALADGIVRVLRDRNLRQRLGRKGIAFAEKLTWQTTAKRYLKKYESVVEGRR